jgi:hypothetical protein
VNKDPKVESAVAVRQAISVLAQLGTPDAIGLLKTWRNKIQGKMWGDSPPPR